MVAVLLDGDALAASWRRDIARRVAAVRARGVVPVMTSILVGDDPASAAYIGRKHADCLEVGVEARDVRLPDTVSRAELLKAVAALNADAAVHGFLVQLPLPDPADETPAILAMDPAKDIDGFHPLNLGRMMRGDPGHRPCTPKAILGLLRDHGVALAGRRVALIGRGPLVGRPLGLMLSDRAIDAVVTVLHTGVTDLAEITRQADVVICAAGQPGLITADMIQPGAAVVGVGISYVDGAMVSDVAPDVAGVAGFVTPPHGSVGPLTRAMLLSNLLDAAEAAAS